MNFGIVYGQTKFGLANKLGISTDDAESFIGGFLRGYPRVRQWTDGVKRQVKNVPVVRTLYGRRRHNLRLGVV